MTLQQYDPVRLRVDRPDWGLARGSTGIVVDVYDRPRRAYEVEFLAPDGRTLGVWTAEAEEVEFDGKYKEGTESGPIPYISGRANKEARDALKKEGGVRIRDAMHERVREQWTQYCQRMAREVVNRASRVQLSSTWIELVSYVKRPTWFAASVPLPPWGEFI